MEHILGGFQLPLSRRLTKMYSDTKNLSDFVREPVQSMEDPELKSLHRKLRIQKDRLVLWGLNWSDAANASDIDESLSRAGLGDLVGSVMGNIKETLAEAEPLWQSYRATSETTSEKKPMPWDKGRFEDLIKDLTTSIDTLYDLSRSREPTPPRPPLKDTHSMPVMKTVEETRLFESTRIQAPQHIDPSMLIPYEALHGEDGTFLGVDNVNHQRAKDIVRDNGSRQIVFLKRQSSSTNPWKTDGPPPLVPVFLEYASFDPIYAATGITPSTARFERLFAGLQVSTETKSPEHGLLNLIGYFEDGDNARFGLIYKLSPSFRPAAKDAEPYSTISLSILLSSPSYEPPLESRYRLAYNLASSVLQIHAKAVIHGALASENIVFFHQLSSEADVRKPFLVGFDLFSEEASDEPAPVSWHELDPRINPASGLNQDSKSLDLYGLALILLQVGLWAPLQEIFPVRASLEDSEQVFKQLKFRCGSLYARSAQRFWKAPRDELSQSNSDQLYEMYWKGLTDLEKCCALDDEELHEPPKPEPTTEEAARKKLTSTSDPMLPLSSEQPLRPDPPAHLEKAMSFPEKPRKHDFKPPLALPVITPLSKEAMEDSRNQNLLSKEAMEDSRNQVVPIVEKAKKPKMHLYPTVHIGQEHIEHWQTYLMPRINQVLRGFYRKHPESVEISLESVGENPRKCKPTILVICTSVDKVKAIIKKSLEYDKSTYGLRVCKGRMVRSKMRPRRSMAHDSLKPQNPDHQERPLNGASIGACIETRHLAPVSFGGLIQIDGKPYGMTVHHMLDEEDDFAGTTLRSSAHAVPEPDLSDEFSYDDDEEYTMSFSDYDSDATSVPASISDYEDSEDEDDFVEPGDIPGVPVGCGDGYAVTQPAIDDMDDDFYPSQADRDEEHLDLFTVGEVYASSGIRRREVQGLIHEIDWALFEFKEDRLPSQNKITDGGKYCKTKTYPLGIVSQKELPNQEVHCMARTSGLRTGRVLPCLTSVKVYGRLTPSHSYQVSGGLGIPGDSGAWIVDNDQGRVCGHVMAWSSRKHVAYICPMEVLLDDIADTLEATEICLPGGDKVIDRTDIREGRDDLRTRSSTSSSDGKQILYTYTPKDDLVSGMGSMRIQDGVSMA